MLPNILIRNVALYISCHFSIICCEPTKIQNAKTYNEKPNRTVPTEDKRKSGVDNVTVVSGLK